MCLLVLAHRARPDVPLLLAANRDEFLDRPGAPPAAWPGLPGVVAPRDLRAGGTWLGARLDARGGPGRVALVAALANLRGGADDPERPSRGRICLEALGAGVCGRAAAGGAGGAAAAVEAVRRAVAGKAPNGFRMFLADPREAFALRFEGGRIEAAAVAPGVHTLTNLHDLDAVRAPEVEAWAEGREPLAALIERLPGILGDHAPHPPDGHAFCKHHADRGTVSAAILAAPAEGAAAFRFAPGPPCRTPFAEVRLVTPGFR